MYSYASIKHERVAIEVVALTERRLLR